MPKTRKLLSPAAEAIADEIRDNFGGMLTVQTMTKFFNCKDRRTAAKFLEDIPCYNINGRKQWMVSDVARKLDEVRLWRT